MVSGCAFSGDGLRIISGSWDKTVRVWDAQTGDELCVLLTQGEVFSLALGAAGSLVTAGDQLGTVYILNPLGFKCEVPAVTAAHIYSFDARAFDARPTAVCPWCGFGFVPPGGIEETIRKSMEGAGLEEASAQFAELPNDAWDDPRLLSECPQCHKPLRFNPFIVDNRNRY
jgi:hypothetical protein